MTVYCDASVMVSALAAEARSEAVRDWLDRHAHMLAISDWVITEFSGALAMKRRMRAIDQASWSAVMHDWRQFLTQGIQVERIAQRHFSRAASIMERRDLKLRSAEALHLALAEDRGFAMATLDNELGRLPTLSVSRDRVSSLDPSPPRNY